MIIFTFLMQIFLKYEPANNDFSQKSLDMIFGYIPRITIGSLIAYYISQTCDAKVYKITKQTYNKIWISNNLSTFISQIIDTIIFVLICFLGTMNEKEIIQLMITMLIFKFGIAILDTPFMLLAARIKNKELV